MIPFQLFMRAGAGLSRVEESSMTELLDDQVTIYKPGPIFIILVTHGSRHCPVDLFMC